jgi:hypothetical protein
MEPEGSLSHLKSYLNEKNCGSGPENPRLMAVGVRCADHVTRLYPRKLVTNFTEKRLSLVRYSLLAEVVAASNVRNVSQHEKLGDESTGTRPPRLAFISIWPCGDVDRIRPRNLFVAYQCRNK